MPGNVDAAYAVGLLFQANHGYRVTMSDQKPNVKVKKLTLADLKRVVGGAPKIKTEVESVPGGSKAKGED